MGEQVVLVRTWPVRRWVVAAAAAIAAALAIGVPTAVIDTPLFTRMTPVRWWDYLVLAISAVLVGLIAATYVRLDRAAGGRGGAGKTLGAGVVSAFAIGCPICNKLVVAAIGLSGALNYWAPLQPLLALASVAALTWVLVVRLRGEASCGVAFAR